MTEQLTGECAFRMMPGDSFSHGPSAAAVTRVGEEGLAVSYTWVHPVDGQQHGSVLVGGLGDDGRVEAAFFDTWHQQPPLMRLSGSRAGARVELLGTYEQEWGWTIDIELGAAGATMTMCNVIPQSALAQAPADAPPMSAGPYEVMVARWH